MAIENLQTTPHILMVRPSNFGFNEETAASNAFQHKSQNLRTEDIRRKALEEFDGFVHKLTREGIDVIVVDDTPTPVKPDAVFPNNWVTFHQDGTVITYPMLSPARRKERREDVLQNLMNRFQVKRIIHLEEFEAKGQFLEGTGSMIIDRPNRLVYACLSPRTSKELLLHFSEKMNYSPVVFHAVDSQSKEIYHTNVMMALGETFVIICLDTVKDPIERSMLEEKFNDTRKEIIEISLDQMMSFAGNMLQVRNNLGNTFLVLSEQAYRSLTPAQIHRIERHTSILYSPIPTIENFGGGSVRCMMAEVFLPEKND